MKSWETLLYNILTVRGLSIEGLEECIVEVGALLTDSDDRRDPLRRNGVPSPSSAMDMLRLDLGIFESTSICA